MRNDFQGRYRFSPLGWLRVTGEDVGTFLQGQCSQDLASIPVGRAAYGLWLTQKGRVEADSVILRTGDREFWLFSEGVAGAVLRERLERFIISDDVTVEDRTTGVEAAWTAGALNGAGTGVAGSTLAVGEVCSTARGWWVRDPRAAGGRTLWVGPVGELPVGDATIPDVPRSQWEAERIEAGIIRVPEDIGPGELPNEGGLEKEAISYSKGCYLGQETVARLRAMGQVRRSLYRIRGRGDLPSSGSVALFQSGRRVGELRSRAPDGAGGWVGFALMTLLHLDPTAGVGSEVEATGSWHLEALG